MTRSRFGFQAALLAGCLSLLAVGCGDDGTPQAKGGDGGNGDGNGDETVDPCVDEPDGTACEEQRRKKEEERLKAERAALPVFGLSEKHLLKTQSLRTNASSAIKTLAGPTLRESNSKETYWGTTSFFTFAGIGRRAVGGINAVNYRPEATADGAPFVVPTLTGMMRNADDDLTYTLQFFKYNNTTTATNGIGARARKITYGILDGYTAATTADLATQEPDKLFDFLDRADASDGAIAQHGGTDFVLTQEDMNNENLNLDYLNDVGLGDDSRYTVHVLEKETSLDGKGGTLYAELLTNHAPRKKDADYLVGGVWMHVPDDGKLDNFRVGGFADGANPYETGITRYLLGSATYAGKAIGFHTTGGDSSMTRRLTADVNLEANFEGTENIDSWESHRTRGWLEGSLSNIRLDGKDPAGASNLITLPRITMHQYDDGDSAPSADIRHKTNPIVISMRTRQGLGQIDGKSYIGLWGAAFFGNQFQGSYVTKTNESEYGAVAGKADNTLEHPTGIAGMVKGTSGDNAFVASFIAEKE